MHDKTGISEKCEVKAESSTLNYQMVELAS